jgi:hypothetical protein|tara:strand:+ start:36772 stop:37197 length:426 start_codon:yes stop_codon:yes gene_type:complete
MPPTSVECKDLLVTAGVGTFAAASGWGIYISQEPESPNTTITVYDVGGLTPNPKFLLDEPSVQLRIRGAPDAYLAAYTKALDCKNALLGLTPQTLNGVNIRGILAIGDIAFLSYDEQRRPILTQNWRFIIQPASGTYREAL